MAKKRRNRKNKKRRKTAKLSSAALIAACHAGAWDTARRLLVQGADVSCRVGDAAPEGVYPGDTPLIVGSLRGHVRIVALLLSHGAAVNQAQRMGATALFAAAWASQRQTDMLKVH